jgi:transposase-like protein
MERLAVGFITAGFFPTDDALVKFIYMSILEINKKWTATVRDWADILGQFTIFFDDRLKGARTA